MRILRAVQDCPKLDKCQPTLPEITRSHRTSIRRTKNPEDANHYIGSLRKFRELKLVRVDNTILIGEVRIEDGSIKDGGIDENSEGEYCFNVELHIKAYRSSYQHQWRT